MTERSEYEGSSFSVPSFALFIQNNVMRLSDVVASHQLDEIVLGRNHVRIRREEISAKSQIKPFGTLDMTEAVDHERITKLNHHRNVKNFKLRITLVLIYKCMKLICSDIGIVAGS